MSIILRGRIFLNDEFSKGLGQMPASPAKLPTSGHSFTCDSLSYCGRHHCAHWCMVPVHERRGVFWSLYDVADWVSPFCVPIVYNTCLDTMEMGDVWQHQPTVPWGSVLRKFQLFFLRNIQALLVHALLLKPKEVGFFLKLCPQVSEHLY